jgi:hypothetical protein
MKLIKDNIVKEIPENLVPTYVSMGWKEVKSEKPVEEINEILANKPSEKRFGRNKIEE